MNDGNRLTPSGRFSPLRYPGGKGKVARFVASIIRENGILDGRYVEPYAGGAAVAWELLLTGMVRRVEINDISRPIYAFWHSVLTASDELCKLIVDTPVDLNGWTKAKNVLAVPDQATDLELAFALFFLNRTNRSGILNGGAIGGKNQTGNWKIDARYNKADLIARIEKIAAVSGRVSLTNMDAIAFLKSRKAQWTGRTLVYLDPPYYVKGGQLYHHYYRHDDHVAVAAEVYALKGVKWMVSYDDAEQIHQLYQSAPWLRYSIGYSAREHGTGAEAMFFSPGLVVPDVQGSMVEVARADTLNTLA